jgi:hypothetical protein
MIEVQLIYTMDGADPELYATYSTATVDDCRDPLIREMVRATLVDGEDRASGAWSAVLVVSD